MTIDKYTGIHCKACGEGTLQPNLRVTHTVYKGVPISYEYYAPSCTICGASILPSALRKEVKQKKLNAYNEAVNSVFWPNIRYIIRSNCIMSTGFKELSTDFNPFAQAECIDGLIDHISHGDVLHAFKSVLSKVEGHNFTIDKRTYIANETRRLLNAPAEMDNSDIYGILSDCIPDGAQHIDYINIIPAGAVKFDAAPIKASSCDRTILKLYNDNESLEKYKAYDTSLLLDSYGNKHIVTANTIDTGETLFVYCTVDNLSTVKEYKFTKIILTQLPSSYKDILEMSHAGIDLDIR